MINIISSFLNKHFGYEEDDYDLSSKLLQELEPEINDLIEDISTSAVEYYNKGFEEGSYVGLKQGYEDGFSSLYYELSVLKDTSEYPWITSETLTFLENKMDTIVYETF